MTVQTAARPSLIELHSTKTGKVSDKWASYFPVYERLFGPLRERAISLLEIGVQNGGSLETWSAYFPHATHIVGCDIEPACAELKYEDPRIEVVVGNANAADVRTRILSACPAFDIVIDDGSHRSRDILNSFLGYFGVLNDDGLYIVEDTHALYRHVPGGGILSRTSALEFFKLCAELTNLEHWADDLAPETLFSTFLPSGVPSWFQAGIIESVEFRNSMVIVRRGLAKRGERIVGGKEAAVFPSVLRHQSP